MKSSGYFYSSGERVMLGDVVRYNLQEGKIVFIADEGLFSQAYSDWSDGTKGFMVEFLNGARLLLNEDRDKHLELVSHAAR